MRLTGYSDRWTVRPGETIAFHVHSEAPTYRAQLGRLIHGDENARGPGFKETEVPSDLDGDHRGAPREVRKGSCGVVPFPMPGGRFVLELWVWPTLPGPGRQGIACWLSDDGTTTLGAALTADGRPAVIDAGRQVGELQRPLARHQWHRLRLTVDRHAGTATLDVTRKQPGNAPPDRLAVKVSAAGGDRLVFAAGKLDETADGPRPGDVYNGKIAAPNILDDDDALLAGWDFATDAGTVRLAGLAGAPDGTTLNRPARLMTGPRWPGTNATGTAQPETHDAIHFHDDDVADLGWPVSHAYTVPDDLPSGVYALRLTAGRDEDHLPFFVAPAKGREKPLAVLIPTMSYLAYANESLDVGDAMESSPHRDMTITPDRYAYVEANGLKSLYDCHRDGSGIAYGSLRRPIIDFRPKARCRTFDAPHQFAADLHMIDWLTEKGYAFDIVTDHMLHEEGAQALDGHRVVVSGSHPEYWTGQMLDTRDEWLDRGGRFLYLGGNGFYWVTAVAPDAPDVIEVRRYGGTRTWMGLPGEEVLSATGERGGIWRDRGRAPNVRMGVGFTGQGFDRGMPFHRTPASREPAYAWIFDGCDEAVVGAGPALVLGHGAAGFEIDKADPLYGTPPEAVVLASTAGFSDAYQGAIETTPQVHARMGGSHPESGVQADILFMHGPEGGAVFSAGSITWSSTLSANAYDSDTSRITKNVIDAFLGGPLPATPSD